MPKSGSRRHRENPFKSALDLSSAFGSTREDESLGSIFSDLNGFCATLQDSIATDELPSISARGHGVHAAFRTNATVGLILDGCSVKNIVFGGPAHLSRQIDKGDVICKVDSAEVDAATVASALEGTDMPGSTVALEVKKINQAGSLRTVLLQRVSSPSACDGRLMLDLCQSLKDCAAECENERMSSLVEQCVGLWNRASIELQEREADVEQMRNKCNELSQNLISKVTGLREALQAKEESLCNESKQSICELVTVKGDKADLEQQISRSKQKIRAVLDLVDCGRPVSNDIRMESLINALEKCVKSVVEEARGNESREWCLSNLEVTKAKERVEHLETQSRKAREFAAQETLRADRLMDTNRTLQDELEAARESASRLQKKLVQAEAECADLRSSLEGTREELENSEQHQSKILSQTDTLKQDLEESHTTTRQLQELHLEAERANGVLIVELSEAKIKHEQTARELVGAQREAGRLRGELRRMQAEKRVWEEQVERESSAPSWSNAPSEQGDGLLPTTVFSHRTRSEESSALEDADVDAAVPRWREEWEVKEVGGRSAAASQRSDKGDELIMNAGDAVACAMQGLRTQQEQISSWLPGREGGGGARELAATAAEVARAAEERGAREREGVVTLLKQRLAEVGCEAMAEREGRRKVEEELELVRSQLLVRTQLTSDHPSAHPVTAAEQKSGDAFDGDGVEAHLWDALPAGGRGRAPGAGGGEADARLLQVLSWVGQAAQEVAEAKSRLRVVADGPGAPANEQTSGTNGSLPDGAAGASMPGSDAWLERGDQTNVSWSIEAAGVADEGGQMLPANSSSVLRGNALAPSPVSDAAYAAINVWGGAYGLWDTKGEVDFARARPQEVASSTLVGFAASDSRMSSTRGDEGDKDSAVAAAMAQLDCVERSITRVRSEVSHLVGRRAEADIDPAQQRQIARRDSQGHSGLLPPMPCSRRGDGSGPEGAGASSSVEASIGLFYKLAEDDGLKDMSGNATLVHPEAQPSVQQSEGGGGLWGDRCRTAQKEAREAKEEAGRLLRQLWQAKRERERVERELEMQVADLRSEKAIIVAWFDSFEGAISDATDVLDRCKQAAHELQSLRCRALVSEAELAACRQEAVERQRVVQDWLAPLEQQVQATSHLLERCTDATDAVQSLRSRVLHSEAQLAACRRQGEERERARSAETSSLREMSEGLKGTIEKQWSGELKLRDYLKGLEGEKKELISGLGIMREREAALLDMTDAVGGTLETVGRLLVGWLEVDAGQKEQARFMQSVLAALKDDVEMEKGRREAEEFRVERLERELRESKDRVEETLLELQSVKKGLEAKQRECESLQLETRSAMQRAAVMEESSKTLLDQQHALQVELDDIRARERERTTETLLQDQLRIACHAAELMSDAIAGGRAYETGARVEQQSSAEGEGQHDTEQDQPDAPETEAAQVESAEQAATVVEMVVAQVKRVAEKGIDGRKSAMALHRELESARRRQQVLEGDLLAEKNKCAAAVGQLSRTRLQHEALHGRVIEIEGELVEAKGREQQWEEEDRKLREIVRAAEGAKRESDLACERWKSRSQVLESKCDGLKDELARSANTLKAERELTRLREEEAHQAKALAINLGARVNGLEQGLADAMHEDRGADSNAPVPTDVAPRDQETGTSLSKPAASEEDDDTDWHIKLAKAEEESKRRKKEAHALKKEAVARSKVTKELEKKVEGLMEALMTVEKEMVARKKAKKKDGDTERKLKQLQQELSQWRQEYESVERELKGVKEELAMERDVGKGLRKELELQRNERERLGQELEEAGRIIRDTAERGKKEIEGIEERHRDVIEKLQGEKRSLGAVCDEVWGDRERLRRECEILSAEMKRDKEVREQFERAREEREQAREGRETESRAQLLKVQDALLLETERAAMASSQVAVLEAKVADFEPEKKQLVAALEFERRERAKAEDELQHVSSQGEKRQELFGEKQREAEAVRGELEAARSECRALAGELSIGKVAKEDLERKVEEGRAANQRERARREEERKEREEEAGRMALVVSGLRAELRAAADEEKRLVDEIEGRERALESERRSVQELTASVRELAGRNQELTDGLREGQQEVRTGTEVREGLQEEVLRLERSLEAEKRSVKEQTAQVSELAEREKELTGSLQKTKKDCKAMQEEVVGLQQKVDELNEQIAGITKSKKELDEATARKEASSKEERDKFDHERARAWDEERSAMRREWEEEKENLAREWERDRHVLLARLRRAQTKPEVADSVGESDTNDQGPKSTVKEVGANNVLEGWLQGLVDTGAGINKALVDTGKGLVDTGKGFVDNVPNIGKGLVDTGAGIVGLVETKKGRGEEETETADGQQSMRRREDTQASAPERVNVARNREADDVGTTVDMDVVTLIAELRSAVQERQDDREAWEAEKSKLEQELERVTREGGVREQAMEEGLERERRATEEVRRVESGQMEELRRCLLQKDQELIEVKGMLDARDEDLIRLQATIEELLAERERSWVDRDRKMARPKWSKRPRRAKEAAGRPWFKEELLCRGEPVAEKADGMLTPLEEQRREMDAELAALEDEVEQNIAHVRAAFGMGGGEGSSRHMTKVQHMARGILDEGEDSAGSDGWREGLGLRTGRARRGKADARWLGRWSTASGGSNDGSGSEGDGEPADKDERSLELMDGSDPGLALDAEIGLSGHVSESLVRPNLVAGSEMASRSGSEVSALSVSRLVEEMERSRRQVARIRETVATASEMTAESVSPRGVSLV